MNSKWLRFCGVFGLVLLLFGFIGALLLGDFSQPLMLAHMAVGILLLLVWVITAGQSIKHASQAVSGRTARFSANLLLYSFVFLALLVAANWFGNRYNKRWDLTKEGVYSLADQSQQVAKNLADNLKIVAVTNVQGAEDPQSQDLVSLYAYANPAKITKEFLDPRTKPHLLDSYGLKPGNLIYLEYGQGEKKAVARLNDNSEEAITNGIIKLTRGAAKKVYFVKGHDEPDLEKDDAQGLKEFATAIENENLHYETLLLSQKDMVPEDASAVILVSPKKPLLQTEKDQLAKFVEGGGRLIMFGDPRTTTDVKEISAQFGIDVGDNVVIDQIQRLFAAPSLGAQPVIQDYLPHAITRGMTANNISIFNVASSVRIGAHKVEGATYSELMRSSPTAWGESKLDLIFDSPEPTAVLESDSDLVGPVTLAVAFEKKLDAGKQDQGEDKSDQKTVDQAIEKVSRLVVFGDSDWILNANIGVYSNRDLALNAVNWVVGEEGGISIRARSVGPSAAPIPQGTFTWILASSFLVPELILLYGLIVWWNRRFVAA